MKQQRRIYRSAERAEIEDPIIGKVLYVDNGMHAMGLASDSASLSK